MKTENNSSKILLINPKVEWVSSPAYDRIWPPLSLAYSASFLKKDGFKVEILDANAENIGLETITRKSKNFDKIFVTTSTLDKWQCPEPYIKPVLKLVKNLREVNPNIFVVGSHGTMRPKELLNLTKARAIIRGEPELTMLEICKNEKLENIRGITYRKKDKIITNLERPLLDLNELPLPAFGLLPMEKYYYEILGYNFTLLEASRGCPYNCIYCNKVMFGNKCRKKTSNRVMEEIEYVIENFNIKNAYFIDLDFCVNNKLVKQLCDFLIKEKYDFNWTCQTRFDTVNYELLLKMKKAGCEIIHFGVESGSPKILDLMNKGITVNQMKKGMKMVNKAGIKTVCFFMFGFPSETREDMKMTINFAKELNPNYASFHIAVPYPGTKFYETVSDKLDIRELFPYFYGNLQELERIRKTAYRSFYLRPKYFITRLEEGEFKLLFKQIKLFLRSVTIDKG